MLLSGLGVNWNLGGVPTAPSLWAANSPVSPPAGRGQAVADDQHDFPLTLKVKPSALLFVLCPVPNVL